MKLFIMMFTLMAFNAFAQQVPNLGENASPEHAECLKEDKCPSQQCANSCAMINKQQVSGDRTADGIPKKEKTKTGVQ